MRNLRKQTREYTLEEKMAKLELERIRYLLPMNCWDSSERGRMMDRRDEIEKKLERR